MPRPRGGGRFALCPEPCGARTVRANESPGRSCPDRPQVIRGIRCARCRDARRADAAQRRARSPPSAAELAGQVVTVEDHLRITEGMGAPRTAHAADTARKAALGRSHACAGCGGGPRVAPAGEEILVVRHCGRSASRQFLVRLNGLLYLLTSVALWAPPALCRINN